jgi:hypothetical protein
MRIVGFVLINAAYRAYGGLVQTASNLLDFSGYRATRNMLATIRREVPTVDITLSRKHRKGYEILNGSIYDLKARIAYDLHLIVFTARYVIKYFEYCPPNDLLVEEFFLTKVVFQLQKLNRQVPAVPEMIDISGPFLAVESDSGAVQELEIKFKYVMDEHW